MRPWRSISTSPRAFLAVLTSLVLFASASAAPAKADALEESTTTETIRVTLTLPHPVSLSDAITAASQLSEKVVAFAFTTDNVTGEYSPQTMPSAEFLSYFEADFGSQPEVRGIVVLRTTTVKTSAPTVVESNVGAELAVFDAPPITLGGAALERKQTADAAIAALQADSSTGRPAPDWRADYTAQAAVNRGSSAFVGGYFSFMNRGAQNLPINVGLEFEVNQTNSSVLAPSNKRPLCLDANFKEPFWAKNYSYSWTAMDSWSGTAVPSAYADYNDTEDECQTESIAIGVRYPGLLAVSPLGEQAIDIAVFAPRGTLSSSAISGNIQAVSDTWCDAFPLMTLTDCMGVTDITTEWAGYPIGEWNQATLNAGRAWSAPGRCWETRDGTFAELTPCS